MSNPGQLDYAAPQLKRGSARPGFLIPRYVMMIGAALLIISLGALMMMRGERYLRMIADLPVGDERLRSAAMLGFPCEIDKALADGASIKSHDPDGMTPLCWAAQAGNEGCVRKLLTAGADISVVSENGGNALWHAAVYNHYKVAVLLLEHGADPNQYCPHAGTPLHNAAWIGDAKMVKLLLSHGANPNLAREDGVTPIMDIQDTDSAPAIREMLLAAGARVI